MTVLNRRAPCRPSAAAWDLTNADARAISLGVNWSNGWSARKRGGGGRRRLGFVGKSEYGVYSARLD